MKRWYHVPVAAFALLAISSSPGLAAASCSLQINSLAISTEGSVSGTFSAGTFARNYGFCSVHGTVNVTTSAGPSSVTSEDCRALWSQLLTLKAAGKNVRMYFGSLSDCSAASLPADGWPPSPYPDHFIFD